MDFALAFLRLLILVWSNFLQIIAKTLSKTEYNVYQIIFLPGFELDADFNGTRYIEHRILDYRYILKSLEYLSTTHTDNMVRFVRDIHTSYFSSM